MEVMGLDLAGRAENPTGVALLRDRLFRNMLVHEDREVEELCEKEGVRLVSVDAPLSLPAKGSLRSCDLALIRGGFRVFPPTFSGMKSLTRRGISLSLRLRRRGIRVLETHPRTSGKILFRTTLREEWARRLVKGGWRMLGGRGPHELDACLSALTGLLHLQGKTVEVGRGREKIVIPAVSWLPSPEGIPCTNWKPPLPLLWPPPSG